MQSFAVIVNAKKLLTVVTELSILDGWGDHGYASDVVNVVLDGCHVRNGSLVNFPLMHSVPKWLNTLKSFFSFFLNTV